MKKPNPTKTSNQQIQETNKTDCEEINEVNTIDWVDAKTLLTPRRILTARILSGRILTARIKALTGVESETVKEELTARNYSK